MATEQEISDYVDAMKAAGLTPATLTAFLSQYQPIMGYVGAIGAAGLTVQDFGGFLTIAKLQLELRAIESMMSNLDDQRITANDQFNQSMAQLEAARAAKVEEIDSLQAAVGQGN